MNNSFRQLFRVIASRRRNSLHSSTATDDVFGARIDKRASICKELKSVLVRTDVFMTGYGVVHIAI